MGPVFHVVVGLCLAFVLVGCGVTRYPGQPGVATNSYSKVDMEYLDVEGLFVYETTYDNRDGASGVAAILTKLYPGALTYTSSVRTNADGTLYRAKGQYEGAEIQMISLPQQNQILMTPGHKIMLLIDYATSLDEVDDRNVAEEKLFKGPAELTKNAFQRLRSKLALLRAGNLTRAGTLAYEVIALQLGKEKFSPAAPVKVETNIWQNGVRAEFTTELKRELVGFLEAKFPTGFHGKAQLTIKGQATPMEITMGLHTLKTARAAGIRVTENATPAMIQDAMRNL